MLVRFDENTDTLRKETKAKSRKTPPSKLKCMFNIFIHSMCQSKFFRGVTQDYLLVRGIDFLKFLEFECGPNKRDIMCTCCLLRIPSMKKVP